ncbi:flavodoxin family protein [Acidaminobacter hydrogenoformans]|uniref:NADPH-dependent FMN reductase n=1 Tax=Acidaminobacter hydrogenoformans DSM 2784 TaxID=1120920 RepID=A0A1G5RW51_9FIRM|nr:flavodoxin family protein [Acidaminobacter hydrogenoformans]SCZ78088.1 NADPH-dependent FMN reductase [Acidaminobacter hydrogenoformans DSM 2784]
MKIVMLTGSPHLQGTTALLADEFCAGALEAGHEIVRFDTAQLKIEPCLGCDHCRIISGSCVHEDDMNQIREHLLDAEALVLVTPLYYFGMTAQLKRAVDRFYAINPALLEASKKVYLISAGADQDPWAMEALVAHYRTICRYLNWEAAGEILALGAGVPRDLEGSEALVKARRMGKA